jgi:ketosteroid isomerase-like protein
MGSNLDVVGKVLDAFSRGGIEAAIEFFDEDFLGVVGADVSAEPDTYRGHDGIRRYWAGYDGAMEDVRYDIVEAFEHGDAVVVGVIVSGRGSASGIEVSLPGAAAWEVRNGLVTRMEAFADIETARAALDSQAKEEATPADD